MEIKFERFLLLYIFMWPFRKINKFLDILSCRKKILVLIFCFFFRTSFCCTLWNNIDRFFRTSFCCTFWNDIDRFSPYFFFFIIIVLFGIISTDFFHTSFCCIFWKETDRFSVLFSCTFWNVIDKHFPYQNYIERNVSKEKLKRRMKFSDLFWKLITVLKRSIFGPHVLPDKKKTYFFFILTRPIFILLFNNNYNAPIMSVKSFTTTSIHY